MLSFLNLIEYLLHAYSDYRKSDFIFDFSEIVKKHTTQKWYTGAVYSLRSAVHIQRPQEDETVVG